MIILHQKYGQMANRIILISHFAVTSMETGVKLRIQNFDEYKDLFDLAALKEQKQIKIGKPSYFYKFLISFIYRFFRRFNKIAFIDLSDATINHKDEFDVNRFVLENRNKLIIPEGWGFRNHEAINKHSQEIRSIFQPTKATTAILNKFKKKENEIFIGLHMRKGDYQEYMNGKYYYSDEDYLKFLDHIKNIFSQFEYKIILFSNEKLDSNLLNETIIEGPGTLIEDFFMLSRCDYIIGPPSTFSLVAAFLGNKKFFHIEISTNLPEINDFKITTSI